MSSIKKNLHLKKYILYSIIFLLMIETTFLLFQKSYINIGFYLFHVVFIILSILYIYLSKLIESQKTNKLFEDFHLFKPNLDQIDDIYEDVSKNIQQSFHRILTLTKKAVNSYTLVLLWLDKEKKYLYIKELFSDSDFLQVKKIPSGTGILGALLKRGEPLIMDISSQDRYHFSYYRKKEHISSFIGIPLKKEGEICGILIADRKKSPTFKENDMDILLTASRQILKTVNIEMNFLSIKAEKYQQNSFYQANRSFNSALTLEDVTKVLTKSILETVRKPLLIMVAITTQKEDEMKITHIDSNLSKKPTHLLNALLDSTKGLLGLAIKLKHPVPYGNIQSSSEHTLDEHVKVPTRYLKVLPLIYKDEVLGTLILGSQNYNVLSDNLLNMLEIITDHASITIANAKMYENMQYMAITDGLTGLHNHRHFQNLLKKQILSTQRHQDRKLALLLLDIDYFKKINDSYGHPIGDKVLKRVSSILQKNARITDTVSRYGGEEFAITMEETDQKTAFTIAERFRKMIEKEIFYISNISFQCTISIGISIYPDDKKNASDILQATDQALYHAKKMGRNQVICFEQI